MEHQEDLRHNPFSHNNMNNEEEFWPHIIILQESGINKENYLSS
ncbi:11608_t:CDS:1, partial [Dentiscutata erythropus]